MNAPDEFYLVLTGIVLNREQTGYRGVYRTPPTSLAFAADRWNDINALITAQKHEQWFTSRHDAAAYAQLARGLGYDCEIVRCLAARTAQPHVDLQPGEEFLGWDVAQVGGGFWSVITSWCMSFWEGKDVTLAWKYEAAHCIAEYFNARLNPNRLFDDFDQVTRFLRVNDECAVPFERETDVGDVHPIAVIRSPEFPPPTAAAV